MTTMQFNFNLSLNLWDTVICLFNGPFSRTTWGSRYQKGKTNLDVTEARDSEWQWHQLGHMQVCISLQTDNHASTPPLKFFTGRMLFLPPNQQRQSTEGKYMSERVYSETSTQPYHIITEKPLLYNKQKFTKVKKLKRILNM